MTISFHCPCGKSVHAPDSAAGKRGKCPACGQVLHVPPTPPPDEPTYGVKSDQEPAGRVSPETPDTDRVGRQPNRRRASSPNHPRADAAEAESQADGPSSRGRKRRSRGKPVRSSSVDLLDYAYWLLPLTFLPLAFTLVLGHRDDTFDRLVRSVEKAFPPQEGRAAPAGPPATRPGTPPGDNAGPGRGDSDQEISLDDVLARLPGHRIEGAFLPRRTFLHWVFALASAVFFLGLALVLFRSESPPAHLLGVGLFTATVGIVLLFVVQKLASWTQGHFLISGNVIVLVLFYVAWAIGFSYRAALDPDMGFVASFLGYMFGVGLCEEVCKVLPVLWYYRNRGELPWRTALAWGFVSGVGFGVSEGITYSADFYNGLAPWDIYLVRFVSCVTLHGIWSASTALFICRHPGLIQGDFGWIELLPRLVALVGVSMVLHGLYDTLLKRDLNIPALVVALLSFGWLAWNVEVSRRGEEALAA